MFMSCLWRKFLISCFILDRLNWYIANLIARTFDIFFWWAGFFWGLLILRIVNDEGHPPLPPFAFFLAVHVHDFRFWNFNSRFWFQNDCNSLTQRNFDQMKILFILDSGFNRYKRMKIWLPSWFGFQHMAWWKLPTIFCDEWMTARNENDVL